MSKKNTSYHCRSCKKNVAPSQLQKTLSLLPFDGAMKSSGQDLASGFFQTLNIQQHFYQWACDACLQHKKALLGNPKKQFYTFKNPWDTANPYLAYFDKTFTCNKCEADFDFTKEEQKHWYEELQFVVFSRPKQCKNCRKAIREAKQLNTELSELLKEGQPKEIKKLERIAEIYQAMNLAEKARIYIAAVEKIKRR